MVAAPVRRAVYAGKPLSRARRRRRQQCFLGRNVRPMAGLGGAADPSFGLVLRRSMGSLVRTARAQDRAVSVFGGRIRAIRAAGGMGRMAEKRPGSGTESQVVCHRGFAANPE